MWARLALSVEHQTFNPRVMGSSPISGASKILFNSLFIVVFCNFAVCWKKSKIKEKKEKKMFLFSFPAGIKSKVLVLFYIYIMKENQTKKRADLRGGDTNLYTADELMNV